MHILGLLCYSTMYVCFFSFTMQIHLLLSSSHLPDLYCLPSLHSFTPQICQRNFIYLMFIFIRFTTNYFTFKIWIKGKPFFIADAWKLAAGMRLFYQLVSDKWSTCFLYPYVHPENEFLCNLPFHNSLRVREWLKKGSFKKIIYIIIILL